MEMTTLMLTLAIIIVLLIIKLTSSESKVELSILLVFLSGILLGLDIAYWVYGH